jgi:outer membrane protein, heavy metal efflux system
MKSVLFIVSLFALLNSARAESPLGADLAGLLSYAREHNSELAATRLESDAAMQRTEWQGALPDLVLRTEFMDLTKQGVAAPNFLPGQSGSGTRYVLMQTLPWFGKRALQRELASAEAAAAAGLVSANRAELASRLRAAYATHYYATTNTRWARQTLSLLGNLEQIATTRYANGIGSQQDVIRVQIEQTLLNSELLALQNVVHHAYAQLNALLARPVNAALAEPLQLPAVPNAVKLDETGLLENLRSQNPSLRIAQASMLAAEKNRDLVYNNRYPGFTLGIAPTQTGSTVKQWDAMLEFNIPLQQSARRAQEREAEARYSATVARQAVALVDGEAALSAALFGFDTARRNDALIASRLLPQATLTYQSALVGYKHGKVDFSLLIDAQKQILKVRQQQLQAQTDMQLRLADLEKLLGESL